MHFLRDWDKHNHAAETSTDDTDEDRSTGGYGKYSHGHTSLSHQHWRAQVVSAGTFDLHCTEGPEAFHKSCLSLPSSRVRHLGDSATKKSMLNYLCYHQVFEQIRKLYFPLIKIPTRRVPFRDRLNVPLRRWVVGAVNHAADVTLGNDVTSVESQSQFLHKEVRLAKFEILDLMCKRAGLQATLHSYSLLGRLKWTFGQKLTTATGHTFWATDTQYSAYGYGNRRKRRDIIRVGGTEEVPVLLPNQTVVQKNTALCCETICFIQISGWKDADLGNFRLSAELQAEVDSNFSPEDTLTFVLVRWLSPHPDAWDRDSMCRPICPGPYKLNHCLWQYSVTTQPRKSLANEDETPTEAFHHQRHLFGGTPYQQTHTRKRELHAYYGLVLPSAIQEQIHATREFNIDGTLSDTWIQSVYIIS